MESGGLATNTFPTELNKHMIFEQIYSNQNPDQLEVCNILFSIILKQNDNHL